MSESEKYKCAWCGKTFKLNLYSSCPRCSAEVPDEVLDPTSKSLTGGWELSTSNPQPKYSQTDTDSETETQNPVPTNTELAFLEMINAQDRTTYAVQSLAYFLFITVCTGVIGYGLIGAGAGSEVSCSLENTNCGADGLVNFGWFVVVVGFIGALIVGLRHLNKSRVY